MQRRGVWEPLPLIVYGYAIHPLVPSALTQRDYRKSRQNADSRTSTETEREREDHATSKDVVPLEVGDNIYAFEQYVPKGKEVQGVWYRGYVVCASRKRSIQPHVSDPLTVSSAEPQQEVFIGIFPASHIHVRDKLSDQYGELAKVNAALHGHNAAAAAAAAAVASLGSNSFLNSDPYSSWQSRAGPSSAMETLTEEDEESDLMSAIRDRKSFKLGPPPDTANSSRAGLAVNPPSIRSVSPSASETPLTVKPWPPRPSLKSGDDTISGVTQPIVDEIASALREWHNLMFVYLTRREYTLFHTVRDHIEALHLGRRQLLAQTLSAEETIALRRDCVLRLVSGNVVQNLEVIVRHPDWGSLVNVDVEGEGDPRSWMSAIRMYAMQVSLAYMDVSSPKPNPLSPAALAPSKKSIVPSISSASLYQNLTSEQPLPTPASSAFPECVNPRPRPNPRSLRAPTTDKPSAVKFYHVFLELRAFVASPCAPGETAELYFSLYSKHESQFLTEEFCAVLNHNGVLARDPSTTGRIRTLFTDLALHDVQDSVYLVCRIVRKGAMKMSADPGGFGSVSESGRFSTSKRDPTASQFTIDGSSIVNGRSPIKSSMDYEGTPVQFRRPFGCAVLELTQLNKMAADHSAVSSIKEHSMPIFVPLHESGFSTLHVELVENRTKEFEKSSRAEMIAVSVKVFNGDSSTVVKENPSLLQDTPITLRLGFPDVVFPGDGRNEVYVKLWSGDFSSFNNGGSLKVRKSIASLTGTNTAPGNIQVTVEVRTRSGAVVENVISSGSGEPPVTYFQSMVLHRNNSPTFGELLKLSIPADQMPLCHLFFTFRGRSSKERAGSGHSRQPSEMGERPFAFAYLPLFPVGSAFILDGSHTLVLYRADRAMQFSPSEYFDAPPTLPHGQNPLNLAIPPNVAKTCVPMKDNLIIRSLLCSTTYTHNSVLLGLLHWETMPDPAELPTVLAKFTFVGEIEIVKFLADIFDSLFNILVSSRNKGGEFDDLVFNALVTVLGIVQDRRFSNFQPVLDVYIEKHFNCAAASSRIIHSMNRLFANPTSPESGPALRAALKVWHYIFKFIARSRELQKVKEQGMGAGATAEHLESTFKRELRSHLNELNKMMTVLNPSSIVGTQIIALKGFTSILPELDKMFTTIELVGIASSFANSIAAGGRSVIVIWKLIMYLQLVKGFLFDRPQSRAMLVELVTTWIKPHLGRYDEYAHQIADTDSARDTSRINWLEGIRLSVTIIAVMLDRLQHALVDPLIINDRHGYRDEQDNVEYLLGLLPRLLDSFREIRSPASSRAMERTKSSATMPSAVPVTFPQSYPFSLIARHSGKDPVQPFFDCGLGETATVILVLIHSVTQPHLMSFLDGYLEVEGKENLAVLLSRFFDVSLSILLNEAFPGSWLNINILAHKVFLKIMDPISTLLRSHYLPEPGSTEQFNAPLWREAFAMLLKLLSSDQLVIEEFSPQRRRAVWRLAGDIRGEGSQILLQLWDSLGWSDNNVGPSQDSATAQYGGYQVNLNSLVGQVVDLCLSSHDQLRNNSVQILFSMIVSEYYLSDHFDEIENEIVNKLDSLFMSDSKGDDIIRAFFIGQLQHLFDTSNVDEQLRQRISIFLDAVDRFLKLLLNIRALPEGEEYQDDRVIATLRLMNFLRRINRDEIYIKYVHQLVNMHLESNNYVEAALTLKLHADLHEWNPNTFVDPMPDLGFPRQSHFARKETLSLLMLDYLGKGKAWESGIEICKELILQHSQVTFNYGRLSELLAHQATLVKHIVSDQRYYSDYFRVAFYGNFPVALRDMQFIYRGYEWEKFGAFCERMLNKHPGAQLLKSMEPSDEIRFGDGQYIQCTAVIPEPDRSSPIFTNPDVPLSVRLYYENSAINQFSCSRQFIRNDGGEDEYWTEKLYFITESTFPTVLKRSEIVKQYMTELSPLETALLDMEQKNKELSALDLKFTTLAQTGQTISSNPLTATLSNLVDNPHVVQYRDIFLDPDYAVRHPERAAQLHTLREAIMEQIRLIDHGLRLHFSLCPPEMIPFHESLETLFRKQFYDELQQLPDEGVSAQVSTEPSNGEPSTRPMSSLQRSSLYDPASRRRTMDSAALRRSYILPPLQLGRSGVSPVMLSPDSQDGHVFPEATSPKRGHQTPLQKNLAHLTKFGMTAVSSGPGERSAVGGSDSQSGGSPRGSFLNVGDQVLDPGVSGTSLPATHGVTLPHSGRGGRFSRFGSFSFGRRDGPGH
ncbi:hypothetical protein SISSUDRAFT_1039891 [Sistotremastrum suecicum HHB10207 ss-3]|uniref:Cytoplasmic protein n=1 Tax=Sistotremastrum suecicum HHB10207 ss-3 TaxID=1314776 RepID=A0A166I7E8_9AGAM|nr:hypothetical protein SISSUDRAFT_1039891 [Sistotremastrum suecicum HHB10207 ss-3]